jgi:DNA-directed RNA polymerase subunit RPC12/RpoP
MRSVISKMATIECSTCSTLLEVYTQDAPREPNLGWNALDEDLCEAAPINRCPHCSYRVKAALCRL